MPTYTIQKSDKDTETLITIAEAPAGMEWKLTDLCKDAPVTAFRRGEGLILHTRSGNVVATVTRELEAQGYTLEQPAEPAPAAETPAAT